MMEKEIKEEVKEEAKEEVKEEAKEETKEETEEVRSVDSVASIWMSNDKMRATLNIMPPENDGKELTLEGLKKQIKENGIVYGIDDDLLSSVIENKIYNENVVFARGKEATDGIDADIDFHFETVKDKKPKMDEKGNVNFHELGLIQNVRKGDILCTKTPVIDGQEGIQVIGKAILPKKGRDRIIPMGKNTKLTEDGLTLMADIDGQVDFTRNKINVLDTYTVNGDVGPETGDIDFIGNVIVNGDVSPEYNIKARGNVVISGAVGVTTIEAEGNIIISKGINGMGKAILKCGENVTCRYIENCQVICEGSVKAENILKSYIDCKEDLELIGRKGAIVGGEYIVGRNVIAKTIGSYAYVRMSISIGRVKALYEELQQKENEIEMNKGKFNQLDGFLKKLQVLQSAGTIDSKSKEMLDQSLAARSTLLGNIGKCNIQVATLRNEIESRSKGKVFVEEKIYPGVSIHIGTSSMQIDEVRENVMFIRKGDEINAIPIVEA